VSQKEEGEEKYKEKKSNFEGAYIGKV